MPLVTTATSPKARDRVSASPFGAGQVRNVAKAKAQETSAPAPTPKLASIPRHQGEKQKSTIFGFNSRGVSAVLLGIQAGAMLVGAPAANAQPATTDDVTGRSRALDDTRNGITREDLTRARRELWSTFARMGTGSVDSVPLAPIDLGAPLQTDAYNFEGAWTQAPDGTVTRAQVEQAFAEMGPAVSPAKVKAIYEKYQAKLGAEGRDAFQGMWTGIELRDLAGDGKLTAAEVKDATKRMGDVIGQDAAEKALLRAFPAYAEKLDSAAAELILTKITAVETHLPRFQELMNEHVAGAKLVDANQDGKVDAGDLVFKKAANGTVTIERVGKELAQELTVEKAMVEAARGLHGSGVSFAVIKDHRANPDFWEVGPGGVFTLKPGVSPSAAIDDIYKNGNKYGFECATGIVVTYYKAARDVLGAKDFDRIMQDLRVGPWEWEDDLGSQVHTTAPLGGTYEKDLGDVKLMPGHRYYFRNWDVTPEARERGWQGENVIYLGDGYFYGHGVGLGKADYFVNKLSGEMRPGGKTPSLLNLHEYLDPAGLLKHDITPND